MTISAGVAAFISEQRDLLRRFEKFIETPEYRRLLPTAARITDGELEPWLSEWLTQPVYGLDGLPIDVALQPGGVELVEQHLRWISTFVIR